MKMADGGYRPAFNVQLATATDSQVITGLDVTPGGDQGQLRRWWNNTKSGTEENPEALDDASSRSPTSRGVLRKAAHSYAPVMESKDPDPHTPRADDSPAGPSGQRRHRRANIYRQRAATAECVNALARNRGLQRFLVRGLRKVKGVALLYALVHNLMRAATLRAEAVGIVV
jgi:hypothetical protein